MGRDLALEAQHAHHDLATGLTQRLAQHRLALDKDVEAHIASERVGRQGLQQHGSDIDVDHAKEWAAWMAWVKDGDADAGACSAGLDTDAAGELARGLQLPGQEPQRWYGVDVGSNWPNDDVGGPR